MIFKSGERGRKRAGEYVSANEQDLASAVTLARRLWNEIRGCGEGTVSLGNGMRVWFDPSEDKAYVEHRLSPSNWATTAIDYDGAGVWHVENTKYGPGTELEPHGAIVGLSTIYPLAPGEGCISTFAVYRQMDDGKLEPLVINEAQVGRPVSAARARQVSEECTILADMAGARRLGVLAASPDAQISGT